MPTQASPRWGEKFGPTRLIYSAGQPLGEYYSKKPASIDDAAVKLSRDADAARLQALGEAYLGINPGARQADAARWQAMGEYYSKLPASAAGKDLKLSRDADAARLQALGESVSRDQPGGSPGRCGSLAGHGRILFEAISLSYKF